MRYSSSREREARADSLIFSRAFAARASELQVFEDQVSELQVSELQASGLQVSELQVSGLQAFADRAFAARAFAAQDCDLLCWDPWQAKHPFPPQHRQNRPHLAARPTWPPPRLLLPWHPPLPSAFPHV